MKAALKSLLPENKNKNKLSDWYSRDDRTYFQYVAPLQ